MAFAMNSTSAISGMLLPQVILEAFVPGYGWLPHLLTSYFNIDKSPYIFASISFCFYALPEFWERFQSLLLRLAESVEVPYHDELYDQVIRWISSHPGLTQTQRSTAATRMDIAPSWNTDKNEKNFSDEDNTKLEKNPREFWMEQKLRDKLGLIHFTPAAFQTTVFKYNAPWNKQALRDFLAGIQKTVAEKDNDSLMIRRAFKYGSDFRWAVALSKQPRRLSTIALDHDLKNQIISDIQDYLLPRTRRWYRLRNFPYRRGYLFYGPPGTGKSSFCLAIASLLQLDIYVIDLTMNGLNKNTLTLLFQSLPERCIVLFGDVDQAGIQKRKSEKPLLETPEEINGKECIVAEAPGRERPLNSITLGAVLNVIDGVSAQDGRILMMTTNHIDQLDLALLRPGRVDMKAFFGYAQRFAIAELFLLMYSEPTDGPFMAKQMPNGSIYPLTPPASPAWTPGDIASLSTIFADTVPPNRYTAAEIQNVLLQYRYDPWLAVTHVSEWAYGDLRLDLEQSLFALHTSCSRFNVCGTDYRLTISALIFSWLRHEPGSEESSQHGTSNCFQPYLLLLQQPAFDENVPSLWTTPTDAVGEVDPSLQAALQRVVVTQTGMQLSKIVYDAPFRKRDDWLDFPYIIHTSSLEPEREEKVQINSRICQKYEWVAENEVKNGEYQCSHEEKGTILKAFSVIKKRELDLP
ncbi:hypothetical protein BDV39DRAFT_215428 [Aspergillus sergii]|uniref:AAA+ ATPase domain-containing protein n=1 Tax=Aspergillus sergii TaxID=1034303 RepID=A0A5N6X1I1_9EURO|nr:hypothetical protein BDV39DRAFT_215428 [Aspergillus sergii]